MFVLIKKTSSHQALSQAALIRSQPRVVTHSADRHFGEQGGGFGASKTQNNTRRMG
jgi:hypothetical protein